MAGERTVTEYRYRLLEKDGRPAYCVHDSDDPHDLAYFDRTRPDVAPHRQQRSKVTVGPWEDVPSGGEADA